ADGPEPGPGRKALFRERPTFLVIYGDGEEHFTAHRELLKAHPEKLEQVYTPPGQTFQVYRVSSQWP
ncbi:MAG: hypothetical protein ACLGIN_05345, partial [Candidatus Sericytochromatia bacterium]